MDGENAYRLAMAAIFVAAGMTAGYRRVRAARAGGNVSHAQEGLGMFLALRAAGLAVWCGAIAYLVNPQWLAWSQLPLPAPLRWSGAIVALLGLGLMAWTLAHLGTNLTDTVATRQQHTLITSGPYRYVRHPFYLSAALLFGSTVLLTASWFLGVTGLVVMTLLVVRTSNEEARLHDRFGAAYDDYCRRTGRFWPRRVRP